MTQDIDEQETSGKGPEDLTRLVEALHPSKEEDERAERFAARLLERPTVPATAVPVMATDAPAAEAGAAAATPALEPAAAPRTWQRDVVMAAVGAVIGVVGTLVIVSLT